MAGSYVVKQKILLDGKTSIPFIGDIQYSGDFNFYRLEITIPALTSEYNLDLSGKGNIKRLHINLLDSSEDSVSCTINGNPKVFKINPSFSISFHPTDLSLGNQ
jgi:hypothetical protein